MAKHKQSDDPVYVGVFIERDAVNVAIERAVGFRIGPCGREPITKQVASMSYIVDRRDAAAAQAAMRSTIVPDIVLAAPHAAGIGIGSYGPFVSLTRGKRGYGDIDPARADAPFAGLDLEGVIKRGYVDHKTMVCPPVAIQTDASVGALGEAWLNETEPDEVLVYLMLTYGIGGSFVIGRTLVPGALHSEMGLVQVQLLRDDPLSASREWRSRGNSVAVLAGIPAVIERARRLQERRTTPLTFDDVVELEDERLWPMVSDYISQLCLTCLALLAPNHRIVLGGLMLRLRPALVDEVRNRLRDYLRGRASGPLPAYEKLMSKRGLVVGETEKGGASLGYRRGGLSWIFGIAEVGS